MPGGQQPSTQTVTNKTEVDPVTQAWRANIMQAGGNLYNQGAPAYYPGQTVAPFTDQSLSGLDYLQNFAMRGAPNLGSAFDANNRALSGDNPALAKASSAANGGLNINGYGDAQNPFLASLYNQGAQQVANDVNGQFMQAGRFGNNAANTEALTKGLGSLYSSIYAPAYESERDRGLQASTTNASNQLAGTSLFGNLYSQGNQDAAQASALLPSLYAYGMQPGQTMLDVGSAYQNQAQSQVDADKARYDYTANAPWQYLMQYANMMNGLPDFSSTTQTSTAKQASNPLMQGLGAASSLASIFAAFGSDRRIKKNVRYVATDAKGHRWYDFHYLTDKEGAPKRRGVMAQEARKIAPWAVWESPLGFLVVNHGAL